MGKMVDNYVAEVKALATCYKCLKKEDPNDVDDMLICDGCDATIHVSCSGLNSVPTGDWLCVSCLEVLGARMKSQMAACRKNELGIRTLEAKLPPLPLLAATTSSMASRAMERFTVDIRARREEKMHHLMESQRALADASNDRIARLGREIKSIKELAEREQATLSDSTKRRLSALRQEFKQAKEEEKERPKIDEEDTRQMLLGFAKLLAEPRLEFELIKEYQARLNKEPVFLGVVKARDQDVMALTVLREPTELLISIPVSSSVISIDVESIEGGKEYYLFGTSELFCSQRDDDTPMDFAKTSTRTAQRALMAMLLRDSRNDGLQVTQAVIPSSVSLRGTSEERLGDIVKVSLCYGTETQHYAITD